MKKLPFIGLFILMITMSAFAQDNWKSLDEESYSIQYPADWRLDESGMMGTSFFIQSPSTSSEDAFSDNVNLLIQDLSGHDLDLDAYTELSESQIKTMIVDSKITESTRMKDDQGRAFHKIVYTGTVQTGELRFEQYYWVENSKAFVLTFTCEEDILDNEKEVGQKVLDSFVLKSTKTIPKRL